SLREAGNPHGTPWRARCRHPWNFVKWEHVEAFMAHLAIDFSMNLKRSFYLAPLVMSILVPCLAHAQSNVKSGALFEKIQSLDMQLFDAYNHCDLKTLDAMVSDDLEFYHDQTGLSVGKDPFIAAIKQNICG